MWGRMYKKIVQIQNFLFSFLNVPGPEGYSPPPRAEGVKPDGDRGAGQPAPQGCTIGSEHTIVIGRVARLGILGNLEGYILTSRIYFTPSSHDDDDDHCGTTSRVLFVDIHAQDNAKQVSFYNAKTDNKQTNKGA